MSWKTIMRPGYLGKHRDEKYVEWNELYGRENWRLVWFWAEKIYSFYMACQRYEDAYVYFFGGHKDLLVQLVTTASNVYDDDPSNVNSGFEYKLQETERTHIQDIAIRRAVRRCNAQFKGSELIQIRQNVGTHPLSTILSPGKVPFHRSEKIIKPWLEGWWDPGSIECFFQSNRYLQVQTRV